MSIDLTTLVETNLDAAIFIYEMNVSELAKKYNISEAQAKQLQRQALDSFATKHSIIYRPTK